VKKWVALVLLLILPAACSTTESVTTIDYPPVLTDARYYYKQKDYDRAIAETRNYLNSSKDVYWYSHAYLLLGEIYENTGRNPEAVESYKKVLTHATGYHPAAAAQALYRLSWIYEREKKYDELLVTLLDLERALGRGDNFVKQIETPVRLANTYYVLNQWDKALQERAKVPDEIFEEYKSQAKSPENVFQAKLYRAFLGMAPVAETPYKSQDILNLTQKELLALAEVSSQPMAERAFNGLASEYERYYSQVKQLDAVKNPVEVAARNKKKLEELAKFVDSIQELRAARRPPELVKNQTENLAFFRKMQNFEDQARALTKQLDMGVQKAKKDKNAPEPFADAPEKKPAPPPQPKTPKKL